MVRNGRSAPAAARLVAALAALVAVATVPDLAFAGPPEPSADRQAVAAQNQNDENRAKEPGFAKKVVRIVNKKRTARGLDPTKAHTCVRGYAYAWATRLDSRNAFEHSDLKKLIKRCDTPYVSENIAQVSPGTTPRELVGMWMHSPGHRANILSKKPTHTGVGIRWDADRGAWVAVQNFAKKPGSYKG